MFLIKMIKSKTIKFLLIAIGLGIAFLWAMYALFGKQFIGGLYSGSSIGFLNKIIQGQSLHSVRFYELAALDFLVTLTVYAVFSFGLLVAIDFFSQTADRRAVLFGVGLVFVIILVVEVILAFLKFKDPLTEHKYSAKYATKFDYGVSKSGLESYNVSLVYRKTGEVIYGVNYLTDELSRRITPVKNLNQRDKFIVFLGDSFMYGEGIKNEETLATKVGEKTASYMPYNYGFHGFGPFDILARIENTDFQKEVKESNGTFIYFFIDNHINRTIGSMSVMGWKSKDVYYEWNGKQSLVRRGNFTTGRPWVTAIYNILKHSRILRLVNVDFPLRITDKHLDLVGLTIQKMNDRIAKMYPHGSFYVLIEPGSKHAPELIRRFGQLGIKYLDYTNLYDPKSLNFKLNEHDGHPSPFAIEAIANKIVLDLNLGKRILFVEDSRVQDKINFTVKKD